LLSRHLVRIGKALTPAARSSPLRFGGDDMRERPLERRRETLMRLVAKRRDDGILFNEALAKKTQSEFAKACELGLEGIVSKPNGQLLQERAKPQLA
jgi:ATP-dependent DNA ligase